MPASGSSEWKSGPIKSDPAELAEVCLPLSALAVSILTDNQGGWLLITVQMRLD